MEDTKSFGKTIKTKRKEKQLSQEKFAEKVGVSIGYMSKIENDKVENIGMEILTNIANVCDISLDSLVNGLINGGNDEQIDRELKRKLANCSSSEKEAVLKFLDIIKSIQH